MWTTASCACWPSTSCRASRKFQYGSGFVVGGRSEQVRIEVYPERLAGYNISLDQVAQTIKTANSEQQAARRVG